MKLPRNRKDEGRTGEANSLEAARNASSAHLLERKFIGKSTLNVFILTGRMQMVSAHLKEAEKTSIRES